MAVTLGVPTSARVATAWRFSEERVTWSKSMRRIFETPERTSAAIAWEPTPPQPTTMMKEDLNFASPSSVRKTRLRASCSRMRSSS